MMNTPKTDKKATAREQLNEAQREGYRIGNEMPLVQGEPESPRSKMIGASEVSLRTRIANCEEHIEHIAAQRDELLAACKALVMPEPFGEPGHIDYSDALVMANRAIANAEKAREQ